MANVRFFQLILGGLITATLGSGGVTGILFLQALNSDVAHDSDHRQKYASVEASR
jgi:hypothetical protein